MLSFDYNRTSYVNVDVNVGVKKHSLKTRKYVLKFCQFVKISFILIHACLFT